MKDDKIRMNKNFECYFVKTYFYFINNFCLIKKFLIYKESFSNIQA